LGGLILDTTVLVFATGGEHDYREPCRQLLDAIRARRVVATTTVEVVQEVAHVRSRTVSRRMAAALASDFATGLRPLTVTTGQHLAVGLALWQRHEGLGSFDAILAAAAMSAGATLVSADKAFARVRNLDHVVPDARGVKRLIAG
jgi:predicted nucleic acid-binding protein